MTSRDDVEGFGRAYDWFNEHLFKTRLPPVIITQQRKNMVRGYFWAGQFERRQAPGTTRAEVALNPNYFRGRSDREIVSILVHEMVHVWQQCFGTPGRRGYHNREWARKMIAVGLQPSTTGKPGGAQTGERVSHYILSRGPFAHVWRDLQAQGFRLRWQARPRPALPPTRVRFDCPRCGQHAWAAPSVSLRCGRSSCKLASMVAGGATRANRPSA